MIDRALERAVGPDVVRWAEMGHTELLADRRCPVCRGIIKIAWSSPFDALTGEPLVDGIPRPAQRWFTLQSCKSHYCRARIASSALDVGARR